ncbi:MAG: C40 family peptidase [Muribaculum sp.]|nr:C40 family peptidase [Muribaculum sp.]
MKSILCFIIVASIFSCNSRSSQEETAIDGQWAFPSISTAYIRTEPRHGSEMSSQALMGTPLKVLSVTPDGWYRIETPEGYSGYINGNTLTVVDDSAFVAWRDSPRLIVTDFNETKVLSDTVAGSEIVSDLVPGCIVVGKKSATSRFAQVNLPDGRTGYVDSLCVTEIDSWADTQPSADIIIDIAKAQTGSPYLWGGLSSKGMDCSGLTKMAFYQCGLILPRDASQQASRGVDASVDSLAKGDLLFFGNPSTGRVNHVGIYDSDGYFIESAGIVKRSRLSENKNFLFAKRILDADDTKMSARRHPWYFKQ